MKPSIKLHNVYHNRTTLSVIDDSTEGNPNPDEVLFRIGELYKEKVDIKLGDGDNISVTDFVDNGVPFYINSFTLGETLNENEKLKKLKPCVIEFEYHAFFDSGFTAIPNQELGCFITTFDLLSLVISYDTIKIANNIYTIDKRKSLPNRIYVKESIVETTESSFSFGNLGIKYMVSKGIIEDTLEEVYLAIKSDLQNGLEACCNEEVKSAYVDIRDSLIILDSIKVLCKDGNYNSIASILENLDKSISVKFKKYV